MGIKYSTLISSEDMFKRIEELGKQISEDYAGKEISTICVLKGGVMFMADLVKAISVPLSMDFMAVSSYGNETSSSGVVKIVKDLDESIEGKEPYHTWFKSFKIESQTAVRFVRYWINLKDVSWMWMFSTLDLKFLISL